MNHKIIVSLVLIFTLLVCFQIAYAEVVVEIPDANLEALIRETIGKPVGPITDTDLQGITELDSGHDSRTPYEKRIADLTGLEYCTSLTYLNLSYNQISDISAVSGLTSLRYLHLYSNQISDIQPLVDNSGISSDDLVRIFNNPLSYTSQKTHIPTLEGRGVDVDYRAKGMVSLDTAGPPTWSYTLTRSGGYVYNWFYEGAGITSASVTGQAAAKGWTVEYTPTLVTFSNSTPMDWRSSSVSGFEITGTQGGTGSWLAGRGAGTINGPSLIPKGYENVFFTSLESGLNMISLPLKPINPYTARSLAKKIDATVVIKLDEVRQRLIGFTIDDPDDGFPVEGGRGYIVNVGEGKIVKFEGAAWTNQPPTEAAPPGEERISAWAFVVNISMKDAGYRIQMENQSIGASSTTEVLGNGRYSGVWADLTRQPVVRVGDVLEVTVSDNTGVIGTLQYTVTRKDIQCAFVTIPLDAHVLCPTTTMLYQNYPNPFNPETWTLSVGTRGGSND